MKLTIQVFENNKNDFIKRIFVFLLGFSSPRFFKNYFQPSGFVGILEIVNEVS